VALAVRPEISFQCGERSILACSVLKMLLKQPQKEALEEVTVISKPLRLGRGYFVEGSRTAGSEYLSAHIMA
jgi:hypothetical protein